MAYDTIPAIGPRLTAASDSYRNSEEGRAFLQLRVAKMGLFTGLLSLGFVFFRVVFLIAIGRAERTVDGSMLTHAGAAAGFLLMWLLCRSGTRSTRYVETVETVCLVTSCALFVLMGAFMPPHDRPDMIVLAALSPMLFIRAIYVPSTARRSALLALLIGIPYVAVVHGVNAELSPAVMEAWREINPGAVTTNVRVAITAFAAAWWALTIAVTAAASYVVYGLRREVRAVRRLGQYTLEDKLGEGGMGVVYRASHAMLQRPTAVKLLPADKVGDKSLARFEREVQLTAKLTHPNTVTVFDYGRTGDGVFCYAMELLAGFTLDRALELGGAMPPARVIHIRRDLWSSPPQPAQSSFGARRRVRRSRAAAARLRCQAMRRPPPISVRAA